MSNNISVVSLANNHTLDYGEEGLNQTLDVLQDRGLSSFGAGLDKDDAAQPYIQHFQVGDETFTLGVIGAFEYKSSYDEEYQWYADETDPGIYELSASDIETQVAALKEEDPDIFIVAYPHWGSNYAWKTDSQTEIGHDLIDSGVDMVIGHGAHMMQEIELYHDSWIVYSLGNFVFNSKGRYADYDAPPYGSILELALEDNGVAVGADFRLYPIFTDNRITNFQSRYVSQSEFDEVVALQLEMGGTGNWDDKYVEGQDSSGNHYLEFELIDGFTVDYSYSSSDRLRVDLSQDTAWFLDDPTQEYDADTNPASSIEDLTGIKNVIGTRGDNVLIGDAGGNRLDGEAGNDIVMGRSGVDTFHGGAGSDTVDYSYSSSDRLRVDLSQDTAWFLDDPTQEYDADTNPASTIEALTSIENVVGTRGDNVLIGDAGENRLDGGTGNDILTGGDGDDVFVFKTDDNQDTVTDFDDGPGSDVIDSRGAGFDTAAEFDALAASDGDPDRGRPRRCPVRHYCGRDRRGFGDRFRRRRHPDRQ